MQSIFGKESANMGDSGIAHRLTSNKSINLVALLLNIVVFGLLLYTVYDVKSSKRSLHEQIDQSMNLINKRFESEESLLAEVSADISVIQKRIGLTRKELDDARALAQAIKHEQQKTTQRLNSQLSQKADIEQLSSLRQESESKLGVVSGDITAVKGDVSVVKSEIETARKDLETTRRELTDARDYLSQQIARNHDELVELKRKGERDYYEFDIPRKGSYFPVGDVRLLLKKTDPKRKKYDVVVSVDDNQLEKRDRTVNEPVQFLVGKTKLRYELVVNSVAKNRISGYLSAPKDKTLAAERSK